MNRTNHSVNFASFCASIGTVTEFKLKHAAINLGTDSAYTYPIVISKLMTSEDKWACSSQILPFVRFTDDDFQTAFHDFRLTLITSLDLHLSAVQKTINKLNDLVGDNDFQLLTQLGEVLEYQENKFEVNIFIAGTKVRFTKIVEASKYVYCLENCMAIRQLSCVEKGPTVLLDTYKSLLAQWANRMTRALGQLSKHNQV